jgi:hypothetical protein
MILRFMLFDMVLTLRGCNLGTAPADKENSQT